MLRDFLLQRMWMKRNYHSNYWEFLALLWILSWASTRLPGVSLMICQNPFYWRWLRVGEGMLSVNPEILQLPFKSDLSGNTFKAGCTFETPETAQQAAPRRNSLDLTEEDSPETGGDRDLRLRPYRAQPGLWRWESGLLRKKVIAWSRHTDGAQYHPAQADGVWYIPTPTCSLRGAHHKFKERNISGKQPSEAQALYSDYYPEPYALSRGPGEGGWAFIFPWA